MKKLKINNKLLYLLYFIPFIIYFRRGIISIGIDIWYMLSEGRYILSNGFPYTDILTFHEGFKLVINQWLSTVIYFITYKYFKEQGLFIIAFLTFTIIEYTLYKLCKLISNNKNISILISSIISILLSWLGYLDVRPQLFSYVILIIWIYIIEKYNKTNNNKLLIILPILSILQVNLHSAYWWFIYIYSLPFLAEYLYKIIIEKQKKLSKQYNLLLITIIISFLCGFINPYGVDSIIYIFTGTNDKINLFISEMVQPKIFSKLGITIILIVFINYILGMKYYAKTKEIKISYLFLLFGSLILAFHSYKSASFIIIFGIYYLAYYLKKIKIKQLVEKKSLITNIIVITIPILFFTIGQATHKIRYGLPAGIVTCKECYTYLEEYSKEHDIKVYGTYELGSYLEFIGIKPYIDTRAEFFLKSHNKKEDIFLENYNLQNNQLDIYEFLNKYNFTHLIMDSSDILYPLEEIEGYTLIDGDGRFVKLYIRTDLLEEQKKEG